MKLPRTLAAIVGIFGTAVFAEPSNPAAPPLVDCRSSDAEIAQRLAAMFPVGASMGEARATIAAAELDEAVIETIRASNGVALSARFGEVPKAYSIVSLFLWGECDDESQIYAHVSLFFDEDHKLLLIAPHIDRPGG